jgi:hypothetical protein
MADELVVVEVEQAVLSAYVLSARMIPVGYSVCRLVGRLYRRTQCDLFVQIRI